MRPRRLRRLGCSPGGSLSTQTLHPFTREPVQLPTKPHNFLNTKLQPTIQKGPKQVGELLRHLLAESRGVDQSPETTRVTTIVVPDSFHSEDMSLPSSCHRGRRSDNPSSTTSREAHWNHHGFRVWHFHISKQSLDMRCRSVLQVLVFYSFKASESVSGDLEADVHVITPS